MESNPVLIRNVKRHNDMAPFGSLGWVLTMRRRQLQWKAENDLMLKCNYQSSLETRWHQIQLMLFLHCLSERAQQSTIMGNCIGASNTTQLIFI